MRKILETAIILIGTLGWWGFVYPELCLTEENKEAVAEECGDEEYEAKEPQKVCIKSRLFEYVYEIRESQEKEIGHDKQERTCGGV